MNRKISYVIAFVTGTLPTIAFGITAYEPNPGFGEPSYSQEYVDNLLKYAQNLQEYAKKVVGHREGSAECLANPQTCGCNEIKLSNPDAALNPDDPKDPIYELNPLTPCGISLNSMLTGAMYGETEPNENIISADPMVPSAIYWGQSMSYQDQDWFYVTTEEPNQIVTLNFRPANNTGANWGISAEDIDKLRGWDISVRDAAGNILAQFPFNLPYQTNEDGSFRELNIPTFVAFPGTYYVVVKTLAISNTATDIHWTPIPYNLISSISFSDSDTPPIDVNFFDVETEPNDDFSTADPLVSTVTMFGMLHTTLAGNTAQGWNLQSENDWFWYTSPGNEIATIAWCQREYCAPADGYSWRVTIKLRDGTIIGSFNTQDIRNDLCIIEDHLDSCLDHIGMTNGSETFSPTPYNTLYFGLEKAGDYFIQVQSTLLIDPATGNVITRCREWSTPQPGQTAVCLSLAPVSTTTTAQYNFTWHGTRRPPNTYDP